MILWALNQFILTAGGLATGTFVDLFLWQTTESLQTIVIHNLGVFISMFVFVIVLGWLTEYISLKVAHIISLLISISYTVIILLTQSAIAYEPFFLGVIRGMSLGALSITSVSLAGKTSFNLNTEDSAGKTNAISTVANLILPPIMAFSVLYLSSYQLMFMIGLFCFVFALIITIFLKVPTSDSSFNFKVAFLPSRSTNPEKPVLARASFLKGIKQGFFFSIVGVIMLQFTGGLSGWGILTFILGLLSIGLDLAYTKIFKSSQSLITSGLGALIFTVCAIIFITNFNLVGLIFFTVGNTILASIFGISYLSSTSKIQDLDIIKEDLGVEYLTFTSIFEIAGSIIPLLVLFGLSASLEDPGLLEAVIVGVSLIPFTIIGVMSKSFALRHASAIEEAQI